LAFLYNSCTTFLDSYSNLHKYGLVKYYPQAPW
jgi:hypothetical protein